LILFLVAISTDCKCWWHSCSHWLHRWNTRKCSIARYHDARIRWCTFGESCHGCHSF